MLWHHNARVNSHQRWKQMRFRVCFHLWYELTSTMNVMEWQVSWNSCIACGPWDHALSLCQSAWFWHALGTTKTTSAVHLVACLIQLLKITKPCKLKLILGFSTHTDRKVFRKISVHLGIISFPWKLELQSDGGHHLALLLWLQVWVWQILGKFGNLDVWYSRKKY